MRLLAAALALVAAGGCTAIERLAPALAPPGAATPAPGEAAGELVAYLALLRGLTDAGITAEATLARREAARKASDLARVKVALALSLSLQADDAEILSWVDPVAKRDHGDPGVRAMASFLLVIVQERRRLRENASSATARLRDERRAHEAQKQRAETLQERAAQLQQKLDALTELEKSLSDRQIPSR